MYGTVLLGLVLALAALDYGPREPPGRAEALLATAALAGGVFLAGLAMARWIAARRDLLQHQEQRFLRTVGLLGKGYRLLVLADYAVILFLVRWPAFVRGLLPGQAMLPVFAGVLAPLLVLWLVSWVTLYWADRRLREVMFARAGLAAAAARWTLAGYLAFMLRQYVLVVLVPLLALLGVHDAVGWLIGPPETQPLAALALGAGLLGAAVLAGPWMRLCWRTEVLPAGDLRGRLLALADRAAIGVADILVWRTNISIANGCLVGLLRPLRYIMVTDALLMALPNDEVEAVFAHEVGHARYHHVALYLALGLGGMGGAILVTAALFEASGSLVLVNLSVPLFIVAFWWLAFGFLSRRCEQECDLYAVRAMACPVGCSPPDARAAAFRRGPAAAAPAGLCEHRVLAFTSALRRIGRLNGVAETARGWRHYSIARRCAFLLDVLARPEAAARFERRMAALKTGALLAALFLAAAAATLLGLGALLEPGHPEHPAGPEDVRPGADDRVIDLVDGHQVHPVAFRPPQLDRQADPVADLHQGGLAGQGGGVAPRQNHVAVADARGHAVAVHPQAEQAALRPLHGRQVHELGDALPGGGG
jgi:Zn-dependent protease with chaperone function